MRSFKLNFLHYRRNRFIAQLSGLLVLLLCCSTIMQAQCPVPPPTPETAIPDNTYLNDADPAGAVCETITYDPADTGGAATGISLDIAHTWQGDLTIFVIACGETLNVMQEPDQDGGAMICDVVGGFEDLGDPLVIFACRFLCQWYLQKSSFQF